MNTLTLLSLFAAVQGNAAGSPDPIRFADVQLETGVRLRYAEQGDSTGTPVILLHGYSDSWFSFSRVLPLLAASYRVFALDQRGHGDSDKTAAAHAPKDLAADVIAFIEARGLAGVTVVGHSMGSFVAQQVALAAPGRVQRLVLIGSTTTPRTFEGILDLDRAVKALVDPVSTEFVREFQVSTIHQPVPAEFMDRVVAESLKLPAQVWHSAMDGMLATERAAGLAGTPLPTLILWGDQDTLCTRAEQDALVAMLPNATLKVYAETGHALHWERPAEFARDLQAFMKQ